MKCQICGTHGFTDSLYDHELKWIRKVECSSVNIIYVLYILFEYKGISQGVSAQQLQQSTSAMSNGSFGSIVSFKVEKRGQAVLRSF